MAKLKPLANIPNLSKDSWRDVGDKSVRALYNLVVKGKFFKGKPYTAAYRKRKQARKAGKKGQSISSTSGVPDLTLTGKMMQALKTLKSTTKGAVIGLVGNEASKAEWNATNDRDITNQKLLDKVSPTSRKEVEKFINKNIKRTNGTIKMPVNIRF